MKTQSSDLNVLTRELMETLVPDDLSDISEVLQQIGWKRTGAAYLIGSVYRKACGGDVSAAKLIKELAESAVSEEGSADITGLSDAALYKMLEETIDPEPAMPEGAERTAVSEEPERTAVPEESEQNAAGGESVLSVGSMQESMVSAGRTAEEPGEQENAAPKKPVKRRRRKTTVEEEETRGQ